MMDGNEQNIIRVTIADDHELVRSGIIRVLGVFKQIQIVGEAANGVEAVEMIEDLKPDVALIDIFMSQMDGVGVVKILKMHHCETKLVMLTAFEDFAYIDRALIVGADGYLAKDINGAELADAIKTANLGKRVFSSSILQMMNARKLNSKGEGAFVAITRREQDVLNLIADGKSNKEISAELFLSVRTVEAHRANLMMKLGITNTAGLIRYAVINYQK